MTLDYFNLYVLLSIEMVRTYIASWAVRCTGTTRKKHLKVRLRILGQKSAIREATKSLVVLKVVLLCGRDLHIYASNYRYNIHGNTLALKLKGVRVKTPGGGALLSVEEEYIFVSISFYLHRKSFQ